MTRTDQDTWDLASSVGATATWVAACRALAGKQTDALIDDPFADPLVRAVGAEFFIRVLDGEITDETGGLDADADPDAEFNLQRMVDIMAVRTRYFDDFFTDAGRISRTSTPSRRSKAGFRVTNSSTML